MNTQQWIFSAMVVCMASACSPSADDAAQDSSGAVLADGPEAIISEVDSADIPEGIRTAALAKIPGMTIAEVERKERDGMIFYDVEGTRPGGAEVELDMLEENGTYQVVEVQRDIDWSDVPDNARAAALANADMFTPDRVIESVQEDGTVIYELFAPGKTDEPSAEISVKDGAAEMLTERWKY